MASPSSWLLSLPQVQDLLALLFVHLQCPGWEGNLALAARPGWRHFHSCFSVLSTQTFFFLLELCSHFAHFSLGFSSSHHLGKLTVTPVSGTIALCDYGIKI